MAKQGQNKEDDLDELHPKLRRFRAPTLTERLALRVDNIKEQDPNEGGGLVVVIDPEGVDIRFDGETGRSWSGSWTEFRWLLGRIKAEQEQADREAKTMEQLREKSKQRKEAKRKSGQVEWRGMQLRRAARAASSNSVKKTSPPDDAVR